MARTTMAVSPESSTLASIATSSPGAGVAMASTPRLSPTRRTRPPGDTPARGAPASFAKTIPPPDQTAPAPRPARARDRAWPGRRRSAVPRDLRGDRPGVVARESEKAWPPRVKLVAKPAGGEAHVGQGERSSASRAPTEVQRTCRRAWADREGGAGTRRREDGQRAEKRVREESRSPRGCPAEARERARDRPRVGASQSASELHGRRGERRRAGTAFAPATPQRPWRRIAVRAAADVISRRLPAQLGAGVEQQRRDRDRREHAREPPRAPGIHRRGSDVVAEERGRGHRGRRGSVITTSPRARSDAAI